MEQFTARAMYRVLLAGISKLDLKDVIEPTLELNSAVVNKGAKTNALKNISDSYGLAYVLMLAEGLEDVHSEPLKLALMKASTPVDLLERWLRAQEHVHSNHRIEFEVSNPHKLTLRHLSLNEVLPTPEETCFVFSVLLKFMILINTKSLRLYSEEHEVEWHNGKWDNTHSPNPGTNWTLEFEAAENINRPLDYNLDTSAQMSALIEADPCKRWTISNIARKLGTSVRTLQRRLKSENVNFQQLLSRHRASIASQLLLSTEMSLTEISFLCGYASSSHFSTSFFKEAAFTPTQYRTQFS